jgi:uncharacterized protein (DUF1697 family)
MATTGAGRRGRGATSKGAYVALLRGINVGGRNLLPMVELTSLFAAAGCGDVAAYIQSGNVVFRARRALADRIPTLIAEAVLGRFGFRAPVVIRSAAELRRVADGNPYLAGDAEDRTLHVAFLADLPGAARVAALDANRSPPDEFAVRGREIYLRLPNGAGRTRLTNQYFDSALSTTSTLRNWRTVLKLAELAGGR